MPTDERIGVPCSPTRGGSVPPDGFADLWEHARLLSDPARTEALVQLLVRRAPEARVLEVGCGTGLLSCIAAACGADRVVAVEPTEQADLARELVGHAGLADRVTVHQAAIEELDPQPMDLVFSELLNADPFAERVVQVSRQAARWVAPGGHLAPARLRLFVAAVRADDSHVEARAAREGVAALAERFGLSLAPLQAALEALAPYPSLAPRVQPAGPGVQVMELPLGTDAEPPCEPMAVRLPCWGPQPVAGLTVWFEADLDDDLILHNRPDSDSHWGHLVIGWPRPVAPVGGTIDVQLCVDDGEVDAQPVVHP